LAVLLIAAAYIAGYWPEHRQRLAGERETDNLRVRFEEADARVRSARLLGDLLLIRDAVASMNYGHAQTISTTFFDEVRSEAARTTVDGLRSGLQGVLQNRDSTTTALSRSDQASLDQIRKMEIELRAALGYPVPPGGEPVVK
jgi:hypothetical protein